MNTPETQTEETQDHKSSQDSEAEEMPETASEPASPAEAEAAVEAEAPDAPQEPSMPGVPPKQAAALWAAMAAVKKAANWVAFPALFVGPLLIVIGTLMPWIEGTSGLGEGGGGYGLVSFFVGLGLFFAMVNAMFRGFKHNALIYIGLAMISFWSTFSFATLLSDESYGLWFSMAGSVVTLFALVMQHRMMPQPSSEMPGIPMGQKFLAIMMAIGGVGALLSVSALNITQGLTGFESGYRFGVVIMVAGILAAAGALFMLFSPPAESGESGGVTFMQTLWFLSGVTIVGVAIPYILTYVFYPVTIVTTVTPLSLAAQDTAVDALQSRLFESAVGLGAIGAGLWAALASGILILWGSRALLRTPS